MVLGLLVGVAIVQLWGLRMSGVLVIPLLAIYGLYDNPSLVVFVLSTIAAYIALYLVKKRSLVYGRSLLLIGILSGALVPALTIAFSTSLYGTTLLNEVEFVGTILPGVAAYNFHQLSVDRRITDAVLSLVVLAGLMLLGALLIEPMAPLGTDLGLPPILLSRESDIATRLGIAVANPGYQGVVPLAVAGAVVLVGLALAELIRSRWGLRADGIIGIPLLAVFTLQDAAALLLYLLVLPLTYLLIDEIEAQTGLYGRITLAIELGLALVVALPLIPLLEMDVGLIAFFAALFAGIAVYNFRRIPTDDRFETVVITAGMLAVSLAIVRPFTTPAAGGLLQSVHPVHAAGGAILVAGATWVCIQREHKRPAVPEVEIR